MTAPALQSLLMYTPNPDPLCALSHRQDGTPQHYYAPFMFITFNGKHSQLQLVVTDWSRAAGGLMQLALKLMEDALNETSYLAEVAGLQSSVSAAAS